MVVGSLFRIALDALRAHRLRSGLTLLGIIIGVTSVMTIISALEGVAGAIEERLARMGPATFIVRRIGLPMSEEEFLEQIKRKPIDSEAADLIKDGCDLCEKIAMLNFYSARVKHQDRELRDITVLGTTYNYIDIVDLEVDQGRYHSQEDDFYRRPVVFIGETLRETFFEGVDPLGKEIRVGPTKYTVVGVAKKQGALFGQNQDDFVIIPISAFNKQFGVQNRGLRIVVKALSVDVLDEAMDQVRVVLRSQRHVPFDKPDDFGMITADTVLDLLNSITRIFRLGLVGISSISVVVGGIVVMNIMMVSVTERTREIGIRKSVGARQRHVLTQFLFESLILTLVGGLLGIVIGFFLAKMLMVLWIDMQIEPSMLAIIAGLTISTGTGLIFGIYPALKAARLDPIKALSYE
jgi:putative ABC transport system permease protein